MKPAKKAQSLSMNTIILAVLALIVLVVLVMIFTGKAGQFSKETASCTTKGGTCLPKDQPCQAPAPFSTCAEKDTVCCMQR